MTFVDDRSTIKLLIHVHHYTHLRLVSLLTQINLNLEHSLVHILLKFPIHFSNKWCWIAVTTKKKKINLSESNPNYIIDQTYRLGGRLWKSEECRSEWWMYGICFMSEFFFFFPPLLKIFQIPVSGGEEQNNNKNPAETLFFSSGT